MTALDKKLWRTLTRLRGQVAAVSLIVASGVGIIVMSLSALGALEETTAAYYQRYRFADVFATARRAPERLVERIGELPGVRNVDTRVKGIANLFVPGTREPVIGQLVSIPESGEPLLNRLAMVTGRSVAPNHPDEVVLSEPFAEANSLVPGSHFEAVIDGNRRRLTVVGTALSPEYIYALGPGSITPDDRRFGVMWMGREALEAAYDLDGAFNAVSVSLVAGADPEIVQSGLDRLLERYGGDSAQTRERQLSNWFLTNEFKQLRAFSIMLPSVFLAVTAFLLNMILVRLIAIERGEIGLLKAFGYSSARIARHYLMLAAAICAVGVLLGWGIGAALGRYNTTSYAQFFHFPLLVFRPAPAIFLGAALVALASALGGAAFAVRRATRLAPAEAMLPPTPAVFRRQDGTRLAGRRFFDQTTRIAVRQAVRNPVRATLTTFGIAASVSVMLLAMQWLDATAELIRDYFLETQRQDVIVALDEATPLAVAHEIRHLPGVLAVEAARSVGADFRVGRRTHEGFVIGIPKQQNLRLIHDRFRRPFALPDDGLVIGTELARKLRIDRGDVVEVHFEAAGRPTVSLPVVDLVDTWFDLPAYLPLDRLNALLRQSPRASEFSLLLDPSETGAFFDAVRELPRIVAVVMSNEAVQGFRETLAESLNITVFFFSSFAAALGAGVVYNSARIILSERGRELASLRVLGFRRADVSRILLGELALLVFFALPIGCLLGYGLAWLLVTQAFTNELYRVPLVIEPSSYAFAMSLCIVAATVSSILVRRRLDRLDLIAVLKTRE